VTISVRRNPYTVPSYSLTGDLLSYLSCGLQYRYQNRAALPPSKPVQLWFGQFIHGTLEESYRRWSEHSQRLPWDELQVQDVARAVIRRLEARGVQFQRFLLLGIALERAHQAINRVGPILFPLIAECEVKLQGLRGLPDDVPRIIRQSNYYEVTGVVDVITSVELREASPENNLARTLLGPPANYEVVVDYKGMRRPAESDPNDHTWEHHEWQVLTYAWLRRQQTGEARTKKGLLLYLNELAPGAEDMDRLAEEVLDHTPPVTDIVPSGSDLVALQAWRTEKREWTSRVDDWEDAIADWWRTGRDAGGRFPHMPAFISPLSPGLLLNRAMRVVTVDEDSILEKIGNFDRVVGEIEQSVAKEVTSGQVLTSWTPTPRDETCTVCDFRYWCPADGNRYRRPPTAP
jgi:CRISPR/Cas system-associated exonuclease Cas4 (RecB family)